jgi:Cu/Ag efflux pump CusA
MTSLATVFGLIPMAIGWGTGGETNAPLARAVVGGLSVSTLLTLFLVPTMYMILEERFPRPVADEQTLAGDLPEESPMEPARG